MIGLCSYCVTGGVWFTKASSKKSDIVYKAMCTSTAVAPDTISN